MRKEEGKESWRGEGKLKRWWSVMKKGVSPRVPNSVFIDPKDGSELPVVCCGKINPGHLQCRHCPGSLVKESHLSR